MERSNRNFVGVGSDCTRLSRRIVYRGILFRGELCCRKLVIGWTFRREYELVVRLSGIFSKFFSFSERTHSRLCSLCKDTMFGCSDNDMFAGPEGTMKCLVEGRGAEVALTTIDTAVNFFQRRPDEREHFEFLCLDGSRMGINARACDWGKHPTNTFVIRRGRERSKEIYLRMLQQIFVRFSKLRPSWFDKTFVSSTNITQLTTMPVNQAKWSKYLGKYSMCWNL